MKSTIDIVSDISLLHGKGATYCFKILTDDGTLTYSGIFKVKILPNISHSTTLLEGLSLYFGIWVAISTLNPPRGSLIRVFTDNDTVLRMSATRKTPILQFLYKTIDTLSKRGIAVSVCHAYEDKYEYVRPAHRQCHNGAKRVMRRKFRGAIQTYLPPYPVIKRTDYVVTK